MEKYITENGITGKMANALMAWSKGNQNIGELAFFYGVKSDVLYYHAMKQSGRW